MADPNPNSLPNPDPNQVGGGPIAAAAARLLLLPLLRAEVARVAGPLPRLAAALRWAQHAALVTLDHAPSVALSGVRVRAGARVRRVRVRVRVQGQGKG